MAIAEVVPKKEGEGTGTASEASIASSVRNFDKVLRSAPKRTYSKLKSFNFSVPEGWSNDDIVVFFDSCKKHLEDLKNNTEDDLKWSNIAKSGAAASLNPSCFTVNQCIELGHSVDAYIKKYKEILQNDEVFQQLCCDVKEILPHFTSSISETKRMRRCSRSKSAEESNSQVKESVLEMYIISIGKQHLNLFTTKGSNTPYVWKLISKKVKEKTNISVDVEKHLEKTKIKIINEVKLETDPIRKEQLFLELTKNYLEFFDYIPPKSVKKYEFIKTRIDDFVDGETFQEDSQDEIIVDTDKNGEKKKFFRRPRKTKLDVPEPSVGADVPVNLTPPEKSCFSAKNHIDRKVQSMGNQYIPMPERELNENRRGESNQVNTIDEAQNLPIRKYVRSSAIERNPPVRRILAIERNCTVERNSTVDISSAVGGNSPIERNLGIERNSTFERNSPGERNATVDKNSTGERSCTVEEPISAHSSSNGLKKKELFTVEEPIPIQNSSNGLKKKEDENESSEINTDGSPQKTMTDITKEAVSDDTNPSNYDEPHSSTTDNTDLMNQEGMDTPIKGRRKKAVPTKVKENPDNLEVEVNLQKTEKDDQKDMENIEKESMEKNRKTDIDNSTSHLKIAEKDVKENSESDEREMTENKSQDIDDDSNLMAKKRKRTKGNFVKGWPDNDVLLFVNICKENVDILKNGGKDKWSTIADQCSTLSQNPESFNKESCAALAFRMKVQLKNSKKVNNCRKEMQIKLYDMANDLLPYFQNDDPKNDFALKENAENLKKAEEITKEKGNEEEGTDQDSTAPKIKRRRTRQIILSPSRIMPKRSVKSDQETNSVKDAVSIQLSDEENEKIVHNIKNSFVLLTKCDEMEMLMNNKSSPVNLDIHLCETHSELPVEVPKVGRPKKRRGRSKSDKSQKIDNQKDETVDDGEKSPEPMAPTKIRRYQKSQEPEVLQATAKSFRKQISKDNDHSTRKEPEVKETEMKDYGKTVKKSSQKMVKFDIREEHTDKERPKSPKPKSSLPKSILGVNFNKVGQSSVNILKEKEMRSPEIRPERTFNKYINQDIYDNSVPNLKKRIEDLVDEEVRKKEEEKNRLLGQPYRSRYYEKYEPKSTSHFLDKEDYRRSMPSTSHSFNVDEPKRISSGSHERFCPLPSQNDYRADLRMKKLTRFRQDYDRYDLADNATDRFPCNPSRHCHSYEDFEIALGTAPPKWFQRFAREYKSHEEWRLHQLMKMQQEHIIVEKQKIDILNKILDKLEKPDE